MKIAHKIYSKVDQDLFAEFSGDFNDLHVNEIEARRKIHGKCVVHGVNVFLWAWTELSKFTNKIQSRFIVNFLQPIFLDTKLILYYDKFNNTLQIKNKSETLIVIKFIEKSIEIPKGIEFIKPQKNLSSARKLSFENIVEGKIQNFRIRGKPSLAKKLFPYLIKRYSEQLVVEIASLSQIVGMECPGEHSTFVSLLYEIKKNNDSPNYYVHKFDKRFGITHIKFRGKLLVGDIKAILSRSKNKSEDIHLNKLIKKVKKDEFNHINALIIGGSRGLGKLVAKIICAGGGHCTITYNVGRKDALNLANEIKTFGFSCKIKHFNSADNVSFSKKYNQLYYFASPKIIQTKTRDTDEKQYKLYKKIYISDFAKLCDNIRLNNLGCKIFLPSTDFINKPEKGFNSYIKAKRELEEFVIKISKKNRLSILCPRLPRFDTDQNQSILNYKFEDPISHLIPYIRKMNKR